MTAARRPAQLGFICEGMMPDELEESQMADVFAVWADRVADLNAAIEAAGAVSVGCAVCGAVDLPTIGHAEVCGRDAWNGADQ